MVVRKPSPARPGGVVTLAQSRAGTSKGQGGDRKKGSRALKSVETQCLCFPTGVAASVSSTGW